MGINKKAILVSALALTVGVSGLTSTASAVTTQPTNKVTTKSTTAYAGGEYTKSEEQAFVASAKWGAKSPISNVYLTGVNHSNVM